MIARALRGSAFGLLGLTVASLSGCGEARLPQPHFVTSRDKAAAVLFSARATLWDQVAAAMQPKFALTADAALQQIAPFTQARQEAVLSAVAGSLGLSALVGPFKAPASGTTAGTLPASLPAAQAPTGVPAGGSPPTGISSFMPGLDPMLKYQAADALFQFVQLLNSEMSSSTVVQSYVPYLVRVKLAVLPYQNALPYDITATISFLDTGVDCTGAGYECDPKVLPILVTDDIERATDSAVAETARQLAAALSIQAPYIGANASVNALTQRLNALAGQDFNSRLTVGRDVDNTLVARIGAAYQTEGARAIVGQTYDVYTILLVPKKFAGHSVQMMAYTQFRNAFTGKPLPKEPDKAYAAAGYLALRGILQTTSLSRWRDWSIAKRVKVLKELTAPIEEGNPINFANVLKARFPDENLSHCQGMNATNPTSSTDLKDLCPYVPALWSRLAAILPDAEYKSALLALPPAPTINIPTNDDITIMDDGKNGAKVVLKTDMAALPSGFRGILRVEQVRPRPGTTKALSLISESATLNPTNGLLTLDFPSPAKLGISNPDPEKTTLSVSTPSCEEDRSCPTLRLEAVSYVRTVKAEGPTPTFTLTTTTKQIDDVSGIGRLMVLISKLQGPTVVVSVEGAEISSSTSGEFSGYDVTLRRNGDKPVSTVLQLEDLHPGVPVIVRAMSGKGGASAGAVSQQISVVAAEPAYGKN